jgi:hypothetical protein
LLNEDKYIKETPEGQAVGTQPEGENAEVHEEVKPQEPEAPTLEEYYRNKGIDLQNQYEKKGPVKKGELNAEWIKKEKLTVIETKEEKKQSERNAQNAVKRTDNRTGLDENLERLGFGSKPVVKRTEERREPREQKDAKPEPRGAKAPRGGKGGKVVLNEDDFPSL